MINVFFNYFLSSDVHMTAETAIKLQIFLNDTRGRESLVFRAAKPLTHSGRKVMYKQEKPGKVLA